MPSRAVKSAPTVLRLLLLLAAGSAVLPPAATAAPPRVVASIPPIHSLAAAVMADVGQPTLLVPAGASPHTYQLRPSQAQALADADVVLWVGESLETFLEKPLETLPGRGAEIIELLAAPGLALLPLRTGAAWPAHEHAGHESDPHANGHGAEEEAHDHGTTDPHIWLDPGNARAIATRIATVLGARDPANAGRYRDNLARFEDRLAAIEQAARDRLAAVADRPFVVFHDAYQYFDRSFGLRAVGAITVSPDRQPSPARLAELRHRIRAVGAACVFAEPQFPPRLADTVSDGTGARVATLDPLGAGLPPGPDLYLELIERIAADLAGCLAG